MAAKTPDPPAGAVMRLSGWIFLAASWGMIIAITVFAYWNVLRKKK